MAQDSSAEAFREIADPDAPLRAGRLTALSDLDEEQQAALGRALTATPAPRREQLARRLVELGEDDATLNFEAVFGLLLDDPEAELRRLAVDGLWESEDRRLIAPFARLLREDPDLQVRAAAALALGRFVLLGEFDALRPRDAEAVRAALRAVAENAAEPTEVRRRAIEAVGAASEPWVRALIWSAYDDDERLLQIAALHAMGRNSDADWLPTLYEEMENGDPERRFEAATAAGEIGDEDAVPRLTALIADADPEVQEAAIRALGQIGGDLALDALRLHLRNATPRLAEAIQAAIAAARAEDGLLGGVDLAPPDADEDDDGDE